MTVAQLATLSAVMGLLCEITGHVNPAESDFVKVIKRAITKKHNLKRPRGKAPAMTIGHFRKIVSLCYDPDMFKVPASRRCFLVMSVFCYLGMR